MCCRHPACVCMSRLGTLHIGLHAEQSAPVALTAQQLPQRSGECLQPSCILALTLSHVCAQLQMNGMNGVPPGLAVLGLPPSAMGGSPDFLGGGMCGSMQAGLVGGLPGAAMGGLAEGAGNPVGLPPGTAALPAVGAGASGMLGSGGSLGAVPQYSSLPLSVGALPCCTGLPDTVADFNKACG